MKRHVARLVVRGEDARDSLAAPAQSAGVVWRSGVKPNLYWAATLLGGLFLVLMAGVLVPDAGSRWLVAFIAWAALPLYAGPSMARGGGKPMVGQGPRGYLWVAVCGLTTFFALVKSSRTGGQVIAGLVIIVVVAGAQWGWSRRKETKALQEQSWEAQQARARTAGKVTAVAASGILLSEFVLGVLLFLGVVLFKAASGIGAALGGSTMPNLILVIAGMLLGRRLLRWFPRGAGEARAARAGRTTLRQHIEAERNGVPVNQGTQTAATVAPGGGRPNGLPELGDVPSVWSWLAAYTGKETLGRGIYVGHVEYPNGLGEPVVAKPHLLGVGAPGSGKSSTILGQNVMAHPGIVVCSSSKADIAEQTAAWRSLLGETLFFDPTGKSLTPRYCEPLRWSPVMGIYTADDAVWAARQLVEAAEVQNSDASAEHFKQRAATTLAPLLYAGMLADRKISRVVEWLEIGPSGEGWNEPLELLANDGQERFVRQLAGFIAGADGHGGRESHSVLTTMLNLFSPYATSRALSEADDASFDPQSWLRTHRGWGTIYVVTTAGSEAKAMGPLVALMMSQIIEARRRTYAEGDHDLLLAMDEIANAPLPGLASFVSNDRAFGVRVCAMTQTDDQIIENPVYGSSLLTGFGEKVIFKDSGSPRLAEQVENSTRKGTVLLSNMGEGSTRPGMEAAVRGAMHGITSLSGPTSSQGVSEHEARILDRAEVAGGLQMGQVRFLTGYRALTREINLPHRMPSGESWWPEEKALPVRLLPPIDQPGPFKALTEWAESTHAWQEYEATQPASGVDLTKD